MIVKRFLKTLRARCRISVPSWGKALAVIAKQRLWPRARHSFVLRNFDGGRRDIELHWLPDRRLWALWLRHDREVYAEMKPKLTHFFVGLDDFLTRAERGETNEVVRPFG